MAHTITIQALTRLARAGSREPLRPFAFARLHEIRFLAARCVGPSRKIPNKRQSRRARSF